MNIFELLSRSIYRDVSAEEGSFNDTADLSSADDTARAAVLFPGQEIVQSSSGVPFDHFVDGVQKRLMFGARDERYYLFQWGAAIVRNITEGGRSVNKLVEMRLQYAVCAIGRETTMPLADFEPLLVGNPAATQTFHPAVYGIPDGLTVGDAIQRLREASERVLAMKYAVTLPPWSLMTDGLSRGMPGVLGVGKRSGFSGLGREDIEALQSLGLGSRSSVYVGDRRGGRHAWWFLRIREPSGDWRKGLVLIDVPVEGLATSLVNEISVSVLRRRHAISPDPRWDSELFPIWEAEQFMKSRLFTSVYEYFDAIKHLNPQSHGPLQDTL